MTAHHSPIAILTKPLSGIYSCISRTTGQYIQSKAQRVRLAQLNKVLSDLDPHILKDIGMEGFDRLTPAQKLQSLLNRGGRSFQIEVVSVIQSLARMGERGK